MEGRGLVGPLSSYGPPSTCNFNGTDGEEMQGNDIVREQSI